jgi:hypothetical protein
VKLDALKTIVRLCRVADTSAVPRQVQVFLLSAHARSLPTVQSIQ